jgi:choline dehydrogenase-like flavoprotein
MTGSKIGMMGNANRQTANLANGLESVRVITEAVVHRVVFSKDNAGNQVATAVLHSDDRQFIARKEMILSAGVFRNLQILMLSGIGPKETLSEYDIPIISEAPEVGKNLSTILHFSKPGISRIRRKVSPWEVLL